MFGGSTHWVVVNTVASGLCLVMCVAGHVVVQIKHRPLNKICLLCKVNLYVQANNFQTYISCLDTL